MVEMMAMIIKMRNMRLLMLRQGRRGDGCEKDRQDSTFPSGKDVQWHIWHMSRVYITYI